MWFWSFHEEYCVQVASSPQTLSQLRAVTARALSRMRNAGGVVI